MSDKSGAGVTVISHDSESRTHVVSGGCSGAGCYIKDVRYTGVSTAQLAALTRVSQNCEQFIKLECDNDVSFIPGVSAWWVSRDGTRMNYWGGATDSHKMCACGVTNSCSSGSKLSVIVTTVAVAGERTNLFCLWHKSYSETWMVHTKKDIVHWENSSVIMMAWHKIILLNDPELLITSFQLTPQRTETTWETRV